MLQVYDRVLTSRSVPTLAALFALVVCLYLFLGLFDYLRVKILSRIGFRLDVELSAVANKRWVYSGIHSSISGFRPLSDLTTVRQFLGSHGFPALFDLPWIPFYLAVVFLLHPWLGFLATGGAVIVILATVLSEVLTRRPLSEASSFELQDTNFSEKTKRSADAIIAMGMLSSVTARWQALREEGLVYAQKAASRSEVITALTKSTRMLVQSSILALGAYLAIFQEISPGVMIAASILAGRALAPVDAAVGNWKGFVRARQAYARLKAIVGIEEKSKPIELPVPEGRLSLEKVTKIASGQSSRPPILSGLNFNLEPGDGLGVIGPSASGKSSLAKLLTGIWMPEKGAVRFDNATFEQWDRDIVGQYIGYLPQSVDLITGTLAQNIARFDPNAEDSDIIAAAKLAGVHELILSLPDGYEADLSKGDLILSGGQVQRIALARAVYRLPRLVVLDEPNANLDVDGDAALSAAIKELRNAGSCVVVMAHRPSALAAVNKVLMLRDGKQVEFGDKNEVLAKITKQSPKPSLKAVG